MKVNRWMAALALVCAPIPLAIAQSGRESSPGGQYVPQLSVIMDAAQTRHMKLWFAGEARNWELAAHELRQLRASLVEAAVLYSGIPVSNVTTLAGPLQAIQDAIDGKDARKFTKSYAQLTDDCNSCHSSMGRGFILMQVPTKQPFGNQVFAPQGKK